MKKISLLSALLCVLSLNSAAFFNTGGFSPFGAGTGYNSATPWSNNSNWNPMSTDSQYSPANDAQNLSRFGAHPRSLQNYRQDPRFKPANSVMMPNQAQPSNWLRDTDFSKTLERIKNTGDKTFFVNEMPMSFETGYQHIQEQSKGIERSVKEQMQRYNEQGYKLSPAAASTSRVKTNK